MNAIETHVQAVQSFVNRDDPADVEVRRTRFPCTYPIVPSQCFQQTIRASESLVPMLPVPDALTRTLMEERIRRGRS